MIRFPALAVLLLIAAIPVTVHANAPLSAAERLELLESAEAAYRERDAALALQLYGQLAGEFPEDPETWFALSRAYEWNEDWAAAIAAAEQVQELGYVYSGYMSYRLAQLHARAGHAERALRWIAIALDARYEDRPQIQSDPAFAALHDDPGFRRLAGMLPDAELSRNSGLRADLDYLVAEARRMHADPARPAHTAQFAELAQQLRDTIPSLTDLEVYGGFMRLLAFLDDGHTAIYAPADDSPLDINPKLLPLKFYRFEEGVYVVDGAPEWQQLAGRRVVRIGKLAIGEILQRMSEYRGGDNSMTWTWLGPQFYLPRVSMLQTVGALDSTDLVELALEDNEGALEIVKVPTGTAQMPRKLRPSPAASGETPTYLSQIDTSYWLKRLPAQDAIYFQFNQVRNAEQQSIDEFAEELKEKLRATSANTLIVDVRHNNGGNNGLLNPLLKALVWFEQSADKNRIFVIAGRNTFSAAQNFLNRIEALTDAIFVGEPSSSSPNFVGEETGLLLPYSRVAGSISSRYWQDSIPGDRRQWIVPNVPVSVTAADYFSGRDAALEAIFEIIAANR